MRLYGRIESLGCDGIGVLSRERGSRAARFLSRISTVHDGKETVVYTHRIIRRRSTVWNRERTVLSGRITLQHGDSIEPIIQSNAQKMSPKRREHDDDAGRIDISKTSYILTTVIPTFSDSTNSGLQGPRYFLLVSHSLCSAPLSSLTARA